MIIELDMLGARTDLVGRKVLCLSSYFPAYKPGRVYLLEGYTTLSGRVVPVIEGTTYNGRSARWQVIEEDLKVEDFV